MTQHWFIEWFGAEKATSHYMNKMIAGFTDAYVRHWDLMSFKLSLLLQHRG